MALNARLYELIVLLGSTMYTSGITSLQHAITLDTVNRCIPHTDFSKLELSTPQNNVSDNVDKYSGFENNMMRDLIGNSVWLSCISFILGSLRNFGNICRIISIGTFWLTGPPSGYTPSRISNFFSFFFSLLTRGSNSSLESCAFAKKHLLKESSY